MKLNTILEISINLRTERHYLYMIDVIDVIKSTTVRDVKKAGTNYVKNTKKTVTKGVKKGIVRPAVVTTAVKATNSVRIRVNHSLGHCGHA